jgi:hypothetical protein
MRLELAIAVPFLDRGQQEGMAQRSYSHLKASWVLGDVNELVQASSVFPCSRPKQQRLQPNWSFLSPRGAFAAYLRRSAFRSVGKVDDLQQMLVDLLSLLKIGGLVTEKEALDEQKGYQVAAGPLGFHAGDGGRAYHDPRLAKALREIPDRFETACER